LPALIFRPKLSTVKKHLKILGLAVVFSFLWGAWWGFYSLEKQKPNQRLGPDIRILAQKGFLPASVAQEISKKNKVEIVLTEKDNEIEVLREALTHSQNYDLIQVSSFVAKSFLIDNVFIPITVDDVPRLKDVSIDFKNLDFDPDNHHLVPMTWGLNGFLINAKTMSLSNETLEEILSSKAKISFLPSPVELFNLAIKLKPVIKTWVETGQTEELGKDMKEIKTRLTYVSGDARTQLKDGGLAAAQMSNGQAARLVGNGSLLRFVLPKERATLWITFMGVSRGARDLELTTKVLNSFLRPEMSQKLVEANEQATVLEKLNTGTLPLLQKASFIRQVPLSRVELFINREALEPAWLQIVRKEWPTN
jgi:spermidine/putrescine-binding protein